MTHNHIDLRANALSRISEITLTSEPPRHGLFIKDLLRRIPSRPTLIVYPPCTSLGRIRCFWRFSRLMRSSSYKLTGPLGFPLRRRMGPPESNTYGQYPISKNILTYPQVQSRWLGSSGLSSKPADDSPRPRHRFLERRFCGSWHRSLMSPRSRVTSNLRKQRLI